MSNKKATKRALLTSILAICLCLVMLIGSTFAWFTDTASTGVNKIVAGNLDVALQMQNENGNWVSAEGQILKWKRASAAAAGDGTEANPNNSFTLVDSTQIFWEPGCTYQLQPIRVVNNGNLALKYKIQITGINGSAKLNKVIDWTFSVNETTYTLDEEQRLAAGTANNPTTSAPLIISGTMDKDAGNDYMNETIDGIAITVLATQDTVEADSFTTDYDALAQYPIAASGNVTVAPDSKVAEDVTIVSAKKTEDGEQHVAKAVVPAGAVAETPDVKQMTLSVTNAAKPATLTIESSQSSNTLEVKMIGLSESNTTPITVSLFVDKGLEGFQLYHHDALMTPKNSAGDVTADQDYYYDSVTGIVTFKTKTFSPFTCVYNKGNWSGSTGDGYSTPVDTENKVVTIATAEELALFAKQVTTDKVNYSGYTVNITNDIDLGANFWKPINAEGRMSGITINGNGHTIRNMTVKEYTNSEGYGAGFIGDTSGSITINDITFAKANVTFDNSDYYGNVGGIVMGYTYGTTVFQNVSVTNSTIWGYGKIGCLLGMGADPGVSVTFKNCVSKDNTIYGTYNLGGLAGNIQRGNGVDNAKVENCTVENVNVVYNTADTYIDLNNASATFKSNDRTDGTDVTKTVSGVYWDYYGYCYGGYADYYVSYGDSSYDPPISGKDNYYVANSEYCVNK